MINSKHVSN